MYSLAGVQSHRQTDVCSLHGAPDLFGLARSGVKLRPEGT